MSNNTYVLVNPTIQGKFKSVIKSSNSIKAAQTIYNSLSEHFNNNIPEFYFTIQKGGSGKGKYYHFKVTETRNNDDVKFKLESHTLKAEKTKLNNFKKHLNEYQNKLEQEGGRKKKSSKKNKKHKKKNKSSESSESSDSSESSSDDYKTTYYTTPILEYPIYHWWYDPYLYNLDHIYVPTFYSYATPYVEIRV